MRLQSNILILDDDAAFSSAVAELARLEGFVPHLAPSLAHARQVVADQQMDVMLLDLVLPDGCGLDLLDDIDLAEHGRVAILTAQPSVETAARAVATAVADYLIKPFDPAQLVTLLRESARLAPSKPAQSGSDALDAIVGRSPALVDAIRVVRTVAATDASVVLLGETGTGKELFAKALHELGVRRGPYVALNCGAVPPDLLASELFGHEKGSFTGALHRRAGVFEQAAGGTLFLDEISEMPLDLQVYLLRVLDSGTFRRVGGTEDIRTSVRVVAASNRAREEVLTHRAMREDLYYRLADFTIELPPLRERENDVVLLARHFIQRLNERYGLRRQLDEACAASLVQHAWLGNVRELRSAVQRAYLLSGQDRVRVTAETRRARPPVETATTITFSLGTTFLEMERGMLLKVLAHCGDDKTATARMLGVSVRTIHNHLARMRSEQDAYGGPA